MNYSNYSAEDFIQDEYFQEWVLAPNEESAVFWSSFITTHPHQEATIREASAFLQLLNLEEKSVPEARIQRLKGKIDEGIEASNVRPLPIEETLANEYAIVRKGPWRWVAACVALLLLVGTLYLANQHYRWTDGTVVSSVEQVNPKGKRSVITLADGTRVWLNADTKLAYANDFSSQSTREVFLTGEAFFDVAEDKNKPFIVHAEGLSIKVLGTAFNVKSYTSDQTVETTLVRGKVSLSTSRQEQVEAITLLPHQQAIFHKDSEKIVLANQVDTDTYTSWRSGKLSFDEAPMSVIIPMLERWYNVTIQLEDQGSMGCTFDAKVDNKTLEEVLELFKTSDSIRYEIDKDNVRIMGKLCE